MDFEYIYPVLILFGSFAVMLAIGVPITLRLVFLRCYLLLLPYHPMPPFL